MQLTKFEHACFSVELDEQAILVDPGNLTSDLIIPANLLAVVVTHLHDDHCDLGKLQQIVAQFPDIRIFAPGDAAQKINLANTTTVAPGEQQMVGPFRLEFHGSDHALIHDSIAPIENRGLLINDRIFYGGDALDEPAADVDTLLLPAAAPWMQIGQAIDYLQAIKPRRVIPTHDAIYSPNGKKIADKLLSSASQQVGSKYLRLSGSLNIG